MAFIAEEAAAVKQLAKEVAAELAPLHSVLDAVYDGVKEADSGSVRVVRSICVILCSHVFVGFRIF